MTVEEKKDIGAKDIPMPPLPEEPKEEVAEEAQVAEQPATVDNSSTEEVQEESKQQKNFRSLREEKEKIEHDHKEALQRLAVYEQAAANKTTQPEEDLEINLSDDDLFEGKHYKKLAKKLKKQEETLKQYQDQVKLTSTEARLKAQYTDFDSVVSEENIRALRKAEPELAETIASNNDVYSKAVAAYKMIKKLGIHVEDNFSQDRETAQQNAKKPKPLASVSPQQGDSALSKANAFASGLTPELKEQLWKEMEESAKGY